MPATETIARTAAVRWARLVAEQRRSGQSVRDFAAARGVKPGTLSWWRWNLRQRTPAFYEVCVTDRAAPLVLTLDRLGVRVEVGPETDLTRLREVLEALC